METASFFFISHSVRLEIENIADRWQCSKVAFRVCIGKWAEFSGRATCCKPPSCRPVAPTMHRAYDFLLLKCRLGGCHHPFTFDLPPWRQPPQIRTYAQHNVVTFCSWEKNNNPSRLCICMKYQCSRHSSSPCTHMKLKLILRPLGNFGFGRMYNLNLNFIYSL